MWNEEKTTFYTMMFRNRIAATAALCCCALLSMAQADKMSTYVRQIARQHTSNGGGSPRAAAPERQGKATPKVCAFVRVTADAEEIFRSHGTESLAAWGDIHIALVPADQLTSLAAERHVSRIEARPMSQALTDSVALHVNALPVYAGQNLPQAYTGRGVVVGVEDIGFDLTHPNFYSSDTTEYRIRRLWDMLSQDTLGSRMPVGAEYTSREALLSYAHSRDGLEQTHGTHTAGTAAGSGFDSPYRGIAYESDICLVSNAVTDDIHLIDSTQLYLFTSAMDALGFKYCFDYAASVGKPCVVNFSEGSHQDLMGEDQLLYAVLDSLTGPGRIIVSSAGNNGGFGTYMYKPQGVPSAGTFLQGASRQAAFTMQGHSPFSLRTIIYNERPDTIVLRSEWPLLAADSLYCDTVMLADGQYEFLMAGYPSGCDTTAMAYEVLITAPRSLGYTVPVSVEILGTDADVEMFQYAGRFVTNELNPTLSQAEQTHSIYSPASAPSVICVGATSYRTGFINMHGEWYSADNGTNGQRGGYSAVGPTYDGRCKPDVMAPGTNVISSYSSFFMENNPGHRVENSYISTFPWNGRTYVWASDAGTSMASPVVTGGIALWLEACPTLTPSQLANVFAHTCSHYDSTLSYPNNLYGHGQIDVYRGLLYLLGIDGIADITPHQPRNLSIRLTSDGRVHYAVSAGNGKLPSRVALFGAGGQKLADLPVMGSQTDGYTQLPSLAHGVYVLQMDGHGSVLIRQ